MTGSDGSPADTAVRVLGPYPHDQPDGTAVEDAQPAEDGSPEEGGPVEGRPAVPAGADPGTAPAAESTGPHRSDQVEPAEEQRNAQWWRHGDGRWVIGDPGRQPEVTPIPSALIAPTRPDTTIDGGTVGGLVFRAVSLRGLQHQQAGTPRQDSYLVRPTRDGRWLVGCVADGVSEGRRSHEAADLVCQELTTVLAEALGSFTPDLEDDKLWAEAVRSLPWQEAVDRASDGVVAAANNALRTQHERRGDEARAAAIAQQPLPDSDVRRYMSSTAIAFVVSARPGSDGWHPFALTVAAGDSSAYVLEEGNWHRLAGGKSDGSDASGAVRPLPRRIRVEPISTVLGRGAALVVMTDGIGDQLGSGRGTVGRFLAEQWAEPPDLLGFAQHAAFYRRSYVDDRTAVAIWADPRAW